MTTADIADMPVAEKLLLTAVGCAARAADSVVPAWHKDVLAERLRRLDTGNEPTSTWAEAKERIRSQIKAG